MAEGFFGNLFGASPSSVNSRSHIDYAGLGDEVTPYELTDTEKSLWSKHRNHFKVNQYDDYATEGLEKGYYSLDDMYLAAIQRLVRIDSQFQEVLDSMDVKLSAKGERKYETVKKEWMQEGASPTVDWMYFHANIGIADEETGDFTDMVTSTVVEATPEPVEEPSPLPQEPQTTFFQGIADAVRNMVGGDATPSPEERTMSDNEKAQIEEHIRNMDIDFKEEMRNNGVTLTKDGNNAWDKIRNAVRDGTLPLSNYNNDYLRGKLEQEGYFTQAEPADQDPMRFGDQIQDMGKVRQDDFGGKEKPPAQDPMGGPIQYDREGRPKDIPTEEARGNPFGGFLEMIFPPRLPEQEEEMRMKEIEREEADLSPENPEEVARKDREIDVEKTDRRFEQAHGQITQEGERAWEEVRMKYLDFGGFDYSKEVQAIIEKHRIPDPVDCVVDVAPWQDWENDCANSGMMVRVRQRPVTMTPPRFGGEPCPPYSELPPSVEEKPCPTPVDCEYSEWTDWGECEDGRQKRTRKILQYGGLYGGKPCPKDWALTQWQECAMPVEEELPPVATIPEDEVGPSIDDEPTVVETVVEAITNLIGGGTDETPSAPVQVDSGTSQDSLLPEQTTPVAPAEATPVVAEEEPVETTTVVEDEPVAQEVVVDETPPSEETNIVETVVEAVTTIISDIFTPATSEEPVVVDNGTTQDSLLPAQTSTPATTSETPAPAEVTVNIVQQPASSGGGGGQTATTPAATTTATTTETTEDEETTTEEPEEESNALKIVGGLAVLSGVGYWAYKKYA